LTHAGYAGSGRSQAISTGNMSPNQVVAWWMSSAGCQAIMVASPNHVGVGFAFAQPGGLYWTQVMAKH
jgi:uncharacterized protein YkwD